MSRIVAIATIVDTGRGGVVAEIGQLTVMMDADVEFRTTPFGIVVRRDPAAISVFGRDHKRRLGSIDYNVATNVQCSGYDNKYSEHNYNDHDDRADHNNHY